MTWAILALLAAAIYTIVNFTDKYVVTREIPNPVSIPVFLAIVHLSIGTILWVGSGFQSFEASLAIPLMLSGSLIVVGTFMLFQAYVREETSRIVVWTQMRPVFILIGSVIFLGEILTLPQLIGFVLILSSAVGLSLKPNQGIFSPSLAFWLITIAVIFWAASDVWLKAIIDVNPQLEPTSLGELDIGVFVTVIVYQSWGFGLAGLLVYLVSAPIRRGFHRSWRDARKRGFAVLFGNEGLFILRQYLRAMAIALGPVALVGVLDSSRIFMGIALGWALTKIAPEIFREDISREGLARKIIFALIMFVGVVIVLLTGASA